MARPTDWDVLDLPGDPTPGDPAQIRSLATELTTLGDNAGTIASSIDAVMNTAGDSVFVGATADALREKVDQRLRDHISDVAAAFKTSGSALSTWADAVEGYQATADGYLNAARGLDKDDPQLDNYKNLVSQVAADYETAADTAKNGIMSVSDISLPISKCQVFWETFQWLAILLIAPALVFGGPIALLALGVNFTLFIKTMVDFANGDASLMDLFMAGLGILAPTTKALPIFQIAKAGFGAVKGVTQFARGVFDKLAGLFTGGFRLVSLFPDLNDFIRLSNVWVRQGGLWTLESLHNIPGLTGMVFQRGALTVLQNFRGITGFVRGLPSAVGRGITSVGKGLGRGLDISWNSLSTGFGAAWKLGVKELGGSKWLRMLLPVDADEIGEFGLGKALRIGFYDRGLKGSHIFGAPLGNSVGRGISATPIPHGSYGTAGDIKLARVQLDDLRFGDWTGDALGMRPSELGTGLDGGFVDLTSAMRMPTLHTESFGSVSDRIGLGFHAYRRLGDLTDISSAHLGSLRIEAATVAPTGDAAGLGVSATSSVSATHSSGLYLPGTAGAPAAQGIDLTTGALAPGVTNSALTAVQTPPPGAVGHTGLLLPGGPGGVGHGPGSVLTDGFQTAFPGSTPPAALIVPATPGPGGGIAHSAVTGAPAPGAAGGHGFAADFNPHGTAAGGPLPVNGFGQAEHGGIEVSALDLLAAGGRGTPANPVPAAGGAVFGDRTASALTAHRTGLNLDDLVQSPGSPRPGATPDGVTSGTTAAATAVPPAPARLTDVTPPTADFTGAAAPDFVETGPGIRPADASLTDVSAGSSALGGADHAFPGASAGTSAAGDVDHAFAGASAGNSAAGGADHAFAGAPSRAGETPVSVEDLVGTPVRPDTAATGPQVAHPAPHSVTDPEAGVVDTGLAAHHAPDVSGTSHTPDLPNTSTDTGHAGGSGLPHGQGPSGAPRGPESVSGAHPLSPEADLRHEVNLRLGAMGHDPVDLEAVSVARNELDQTGPAFTRADFRARADHIAAHLADRDPGRLPGGAPHTPDGPLAAGGDVDVPDVRVSGSGSAAEHPFSAADLTGDLRARLNRPELLDAVVDGVELHGLTELERAKRVFRHPDLDPELAAALGRPDLGRDLAKEFPRAKGQVGVDLRLKLGALMGRPEFADRGLAAEIRAKGLAEAVGSDLAKKLGGPQKLETDLAKALRKVETPAKPRVLAQPGYATGDQFGIAAALMGDKNLHVVVVTGMADRVATDKGPAIFKFYKDSGIESDRIHLARVEHGENVDSAAKRLAGEFMPGVKPDVVPVGTGTTWVADNFSVGVRRLVREHWKLDDAGFSAAEKSHLGQWLGDRGIAPSSERDTIVLWSRFSGKKGDVHVEHDTSYTGIEQILGALKLDKEASGGTGPLVLIAGDAFADPGKAGRYPAMAEKFTGEGLEVHDLTHFWETDDAGKQALKSWGGDSRIGQMRLYEYLRQNSGELRHLGFRSGNLEALALSGHTVRYLEEPLSHGGDRMVKWHAAQNSPLSAPGTGKFGKGLSLAPGYERILVKEPPTRSGKFIASQMAEIKALKKAGTLPAGEAKVMENALLHPDWAFGAHKDVMKPAEMAKFAKGFAADDLDTITGYLTGGHPAVARPQPATAVPPHAPLPGTSTEAGAVRAAIPGGDTHAESHTVAAPGTGVIDTGPAAHHAPDVSGTSHTPDLPNTSPDTGHAGDSGLPHEQGPSVAPPGTASTPPGTASAPRGTESVPGAHPLSPEADLRHEVNLRLGAMGRDPVDLEAVTTAHTELEKTGPAFTRADFRARADHIAAHLVDRDPGHLPGGAPGTTPHDLAVPSLGSLPGEPHAAASGAAVAGPSGLSGSAGIGREFIGAPGDFLRDRQVLLRMDEGLRTRTPDLGIDYGRFLHWMDRQDRHWFTLTPRADADSVQKVYLLTPAIEKYAHEFAGDGQLAAIVDGRELPTLGGEGDYIAAHYVPYFQGESADAEAQVGHRVIPVERGGDFNPDLVFTGAMNGCAFAVTPERGGEAFTAWHYQSPTTNWSHSAKFRMERRPTDWYGDAEYQSLGTSSYPETTNVLVRTDDGWHILSQENHSDLLNPKLSALNRYRSRPLELKPGREWVYRAGIYRRMAEEWSEKLQSLETRRVVRLGNNPADLMLRSAFDLLKQQAERDIRLLGDVTGNDSFVDVALRQAGDHSDTAHLVGAFLKKHGDEVKVEEAKNKAAWTWGKTSGSNSLLREQIIFDINDNLGVRWGDRLREEADVLRTPPTGAGEPLPQVTPHDGHGPSGGPGGDLWQTEPGAGSHALSPEADLRHEVNLRLGRIGHDPVGPEVVGAAHGELEDIRGAAFTRADFRARADEIAVRIAGLEPGGLPGGAPGAVASEPGVPSSPGFESHEEPVAGSSAHAYGSAPEAMPGVVPDVTPASAPEAVAVPHGDGAVSVSDLVTGLAELELDVPTSHTVGSELPHNSVPDGVSTPTGAVGLPHEASHAGTDTSPFPSPQSGGGILSRPSVLDEILGRRTEDAGLNSGSTGLGGDTLPAPEQVDGLPPRPELIDQLVSGSDSRTAVAEPVVPGGGDALSVTEDIATPSGHLDELVADVDNRPALAEPVAAGNESLTMTTDIPTSREHLDQGLRLTGANGLPADGDRVVRTGPDGVPSVTGLDGTPLPGAVTDLGGGRGFRITDDTTGVSVRHDTLGRLQGTDVALADARGVRGGLFAAEDGTGGRVLTDTAGGPVAGRTLTELPDGAGFRITDDATGVSARYGTDGGHREVGIALADPGTGLRGQRFAVPDGAAHRLTDAAGTPLSERITALPEGAGFRVDTPTGYATFGPEGAVTGDGLRLTGHDGTTGYVDRPLRGDPRWLDGDFVPDPTRMAVLRQESHVDLVSPDGAFQRFDGNGVHVADGAPLPNEPGGRILVTGHPGAGATRGTPWLEDRAGNALTDWKATPREQNGVRFTYERHGAPRHGEFLELGADGTLVRQGFNVLDTGRPTPFRYEVDHVAGTWHRTDARGERQAPGLFHSGKADRAGAANGRLRLLSSTKGAVPVFERRLLAGGDVLDAFRRTDTVQFGRTNPRTTWMRWSQEGEVRGSGTRHYDTAGTGWVDKGTQGAVREFREGLQKYEGKAGHVLAERAGDGSWTWHRYDGAGRELGSGPRVRDRHDSGWTDRAGDGRIVQRQWGMGRLPEHQWHYQEFTLQSDGTLRDTWQGQSPQGKETGRREVFDHGRLTTERWSEQRPPLWARNLVPGAGRPQGLYAHVASDNGYQLFTWTKEAAGVESSAAHVESGVRYAGMDGGTLDLRADGSFARSTTKLFDGTTLKVGDHAGRPPYEGDGVPWRNGDRSGYRDAVQNRPGVLWADSFRDAEGTWVVREGLPGGQVREYATPQALDGPVGRGAWVTRDAHGNLTGLRHPDPAHEGHHVEGTGPADSDRWTWRRLDADGNEQASGRREFARGSNDTRLPWDDSYRDYDAAGGLVRERRMLDSGRHVDAWRDPAGDRWPAAEFNRQGIRVASGQEQLRTWWDGRAWQDRWTPGARRFRDHLTQPGPDGTPTTVVVRETPPHSGGPLRVREYAGGEGVTPYSVWKEYDHGTVVRQRVADNGGFLETDVWRGQWNRYAGNGDLVAQRTDSGLVFESDMLGRMRLTGNEYDFRGPVTELRGWGRRIREAQRMPWSGTVLPVSPDGTGAGAGAGEAALREARHEPYWQSVARKAALEFGQEFLLEFGANLAVNGIVEAIQGDPFSGKDVLKSFANAAVGSAVKTGVSHLVHENRMAGFRELGQYRAGLSNLDSGKHWNRRPGNHDKFWGNEWGGNENPTRWRQGTYDFAFGAGSSVLSGFVNGSMNAAVWGVTDADGNKVKLHGWAALGDGGINGLASLTTSSATGLAKTVFMNSAAGRLFHRQGFMDFWLQLPFKIFEKTIQSVYLTSIFRARINPDWYRSQQPHPGASSEDQGRQ